MILKTWADMTKIILAGLNLEQKRKIKEIKTKLEMDYNYGGYENLWNHFFHKIDYLFHHRYKDMGKLT